MRGGSGEDEKMMAKALGVTVKALRQGHAGVRRDAGKAAEAVAVAAEAAGAEAAAAAAAEAEAAEAVAVAAEAEAAEAAGAAGADSLSHGGGIQYINIPEGYKIQRILGDGHCFYYSALCLTKIAKGEAGCRLVDGTARATDEEIGILRDRVATWIECNMDTKLRGNFPYTALMEISQYGADEDYKANSANAIQKYIEGVR